MDSDKYKTIKEKAISEGYYSEKRSKFLAFAHHVDSVEEALEIVKEYRKKYYDARHCCYAYRVGFDGTEFRANDDGEPSGTAGAPMLDILVKNNIKNACATVIRYYGGTKLGTGGLVRAYGGGVIKNGKLEGKAYEYYENGKVLREEVYVNGEANGPAKSYHENGKIEYEIDKTNFIVNNIDYTDKLLYTIYVMQEDYSNFETWIANLTNGQFKIISSREKQLEFDIQ